MATGSPEQFVDSLIDSSATNLADIEHDLFDNLDSLEHRRGELFDAAGALIWKADTDHRDAFMDHAKLWIGDMRLSYHAAAKVDQRDLNFGAFVARIHLRERGLMQELVAETFDCQRPPTYIPAETDLAREANRALHNGTMAVTGKLLANELVVLTRQFSGHVLGHWGS